MSKKSLIAGPEQPVREIVRMRIAALAGNCIDGLDIVGTHFVEAACWKVATKSFSRTPGFNSS